MKLILNHFKFGTCGTRDCYKVTIQSDWFKTITYDLHQAADGKTYILNTNKYPSKQEALDFLRDNYSQLEKVLEESQLPLKGI